MTWTEALLVPILALVLLPIALILALVVVVGGTE
jgi:hypothetical protein